MDYRRANRAFLYMIISTLALTLLLSYWMVVTGGTVSIFMNNFLCEMVVLIPTMAVVLYSGEKISNVIPFKKVKLSTVFLTVVYLFTLFPLVTFVNYFSMMFVENMVSTISDEVLAMPMWMMLLSMGLIGPFVEEIVFRGVILHSYQKSGRIIGSIILSSILFGMMHLNFNQFAYGTVMGIMFCLLVEATGSVVPSFLAHALFNSIEVVTMYAMPGTLGEADEIIDEYTANENMLLMLGIYFVLAVIFTAIALCVVYKISEIEKRRDFISSIPMYPRQGYRLITLPLVIAIVISVLYMVFVAYMLK